MNYVTGATTALITPFKNGKLDEAAYARLIQRQIDNGIDAVCPVGTTGESATLSHDEHKRCIEIAVEVCKNSRVKVLAGAGSNATHEAIDIARHAQSCGVDAIFSVSPYYNKPSQEGLYQHYKAIAEAVKLPIIVYSVWGRTGINVLPATLQRLAEIDNIIGVKEASGNIGQMGKVLDQRTGITAHPGPLGDRRLNIKANVQ